jgi:hypothetical protein
LNYQIKTIGGALWLVPNAASDPLTNDVRISIPYINGPKLLAGDTRHNINGTIKLEWQPATQPIAALITVPNSIITDNDRGKLKDAWKQFVAALDEQANETFQYMIPEGPAVVLSQLLQNMPMPQHEVKYYQLRLGFDDTPYIDLQPGMRLKLAFANYYNEAHTGAGQQQKGFAGTGVSYAYMQSGQNGSYLGFNSYMDMQRVSITAAPDDLVEKNVKLLANIIDLAAANKHKYYRLLYPKGDFVTSDKPGLDLQKSVSLAGASSYKDLPDLSLPLLADAPNYHLSLFNGRCVVTPEILIRVNSIPVYVSVGSVLKNLLEKELLTGISPDKLTVLRYYNGQKNKVTFEGRVATDLYLLPGDDISWVPTANFALNERVKAIYRITNPAPEALKLGELTVQSFGADQSVVLPLANDMGVALVGSHLPSYGAAQIGQTLFPIYNAAPYTQEYKGEELAYSLYFAGFEVVEVSKGVVAGVKPELAIPEGRKLVEFLLQSGIGYNVRDVSKGIYQSLNNSDRDNARYMVKALIAGSAASNQPYHPQKVAEGIYYAVDYNTGNAFEFAAALMLGSDEAKLPGVYSVGDISRFLFITYQGDNNKILTKLELANALANACKGQALGYNVLQVAEGVAAVYLDITADQMGSTLKDCNTGYSMQQVSDGTYAVTYQTGGKIDVHKLVKILYDLYAGKPDTSAHLHIDVAKTVKSTIQDTQVDALARALADAFGYKAENEQQVIDLVEALDAVHNFDAKSQDDLNKLAAALKGAIALNNRDQKHGQHVSKALKAIKNGTVGIRENAWAVKLALVYNGDDQQDVTSLVGSLFYAYQPQVDVNTLAATTAVVFWYINTRRDQLVHLATGLRDALGYSKESIEQAELTANALDLAIRDISEADLMWTIAEVFDCKPTTADQAHVNFLARLTKAVYKIDLNDEAGVKRLSVDLVATFNLITDGNYTEVSVGIIANALVFAFHYQGGNESNVAIVASAVFASFPKLDQEMLGRVLFAAFKYHAFTPLQTELDYLAKAIKIRYYASQSDDKIFNDDEYLFTGVEPLFNLVRVIINVFGLIQDGSRYEKIVLSQVAGAVKYAFANQGENAQKAMTAIMALIKLFPAVDNNTAFNAVVPVFQVTISQSDEGGRDPANQRKFQFLLYGPMLGRDIESTDDAAIIEVLKSAVDYLGFNIRAVGTLGLLTTGAAVLARVFTLNQDNANRCLKLVVASAGFLQPEPWLYTALGELGKGLKIAYPDMYPGEFIKAFRYALPGVLPSYMGIAMVKTLDLDQSLGSLDLVATSIADNYDFKAFGDGEKLAFGLLFDQCGWKGDKFDIKLDWCKRRFNDWRVNDDMYLRITSEEEIFQTSSTLFLQNNSPLQVTTALKSKFSADPFYQAMTGIILCIDYYYLSPADSIKPVATAFKANGYLKDACLLAFLALYYGRWTDQDTAMVNDIFNQPGDSKKDNVEPDQMKMGFREIMEEVFNRSQQRKA